MGDRTRGGRPALELRFARPAPADLEDRLHAALDDHQPVGILEPRPDVWQVFFPSADARAAAAAALDRLAHADAFTLESLDVPDEGWAERAQADLRAVRVGDLVVAPPWDVPADAATGALVLIRPSMGFGTGHHESTRLCLRALQRVGARGRRCLDVGTGSGVLALAAHRLGATHVLGVDHDADAIASAEETLSLNAVPEGWVRFKEVDFRALNLDPADLVVANLTGAVLIRDAETLRTLTRSGGQLVVSGFTRDETEAVRRAFLPGCEVVHLDVENHWVALTLQRVS